MQLIPGGDSNHCEAKYNTNTWIKVAKQPTRGARSTRNTIWHGYLFIYLVWVHSCMFHNVIVHNERRCTRVHTVLKGV